MVALHNQLPELYGNTSADPGRDRYPGDMVDRCPEGAGGGNVRTYLCDPDGRVRHLLLGYWRPDRFLEELDHAELDPVVHAREHEQRAGAQEATILHALAEVAADRDRPIREVLDRIEDEIYTKGRIG